jgi:gliding motility-associated-like protein
MRPLALLLFCVLNSALIGQNCDPSISSNPISSKKAFEIVSILVDACDGNKEGQNEMVRLKTGKYSLPVNNFYVPDYKSGMVNWGSSSNAWRDFAALNNSLASKVNALNANVKAANNCGFFKFLGPNDQIPPYSDVLIITSTDFNPYAHDFGGLNDTVILLIQNKGNTAGHFANYGGSSSARTLILGNSGNTDTVTYNINSLIKQNGSKGSEDGAGVEFTHTGAPKYVNYGCKIPYPEFKVDAGQNLTVTCDDSCVQLKGMVMGYGCVRWFSSSGGRFDDSSKLNAIFCMPKSGIQQIVLHLEAYSSCGKWERDSLVIWNQAIQPQAFFELDSTFKPVWTVKNLSQNADQYRWVIRKANGTDTQFNTATLAEWPIIRAEDPGKYTICLEASIGFCKDTVCREINVLGENEPFIYLANVFTPGSKDGLNDEFKVVSLGLISYSIKVYNRWGDLVFKSTDVSESWNGKVQNQGENCPAGNYFYILDYQLQGQPKKNVNGVVNLIR